MARKKKWIKGAIKNPGSFTRWCKSRGYPSANEACIRAGLASKDPKVRKRAQLARTLRALARKRKKK